MTSENGAPKNRTRDGVIIFLALVGFALVLGGFGYNKYTVGMESESWPSATCKITYSQVSQRRSDKKTQHYPVVLYAFSVKAKPYTGNRISSSDTSEKTR